MNKKSFIGSLVIFLVFVLVFLIAFYVIRAISLQPYGYYDGDYICHQARNDSYFLDNFRNKTLSHEECHYLVDQDKKHFCGSFSFMRQVPIETKVSFTCPEHKNVSMSDYKLKCQTVEEDTVFCVKGQYDYIIYDGKKI